MPAPDPLKPDLSLLCKIGSIVVHVDEAMSSKGHEFDVHAMRGLFQDAELRKWIKDMGVYLPRKR